MALTTVQSGLLGSDAQALSFRNRIINGDMRIDQRNAGAAVTPTTNVYSIDRWMAISDASSKYSIQQVADAPVGFKYSLKATSLSAYSAGTTELFGLWQWVEGYNSADLSFGSADARSITLSFWVKSSLTGSFGGSIQNSNYTYGYPFNFTISAANVWEYKTISITGATGGSWLTTNDRGLLVCFSLGAGSARSNSTPNAWTSTQYSFTPTGTTSVVGTNGATFYVTGVQLEKGTVATPFENRSYGTEFALCQRYFNYTSMHSAGWCVSATKAIAGLSFPMMRATPSVTCVSGNIGYGPGGQQNITAMDSPGQSSTASFYAGFNIGGGMTTNAGCIVSAGIQLAAEL